MFYLHEEIDLQVGTDTWGSSQSPTSEFAIVFEDDEETAYLYALDTTKQQQPIIDALHIYDVDSVTDKDIPSKVQLCWHENGLIALLFINDYPHVVYDFENKIGYSRSNFPEAEPNSGWQHQILTDEFVTKLSQ